VDTLELAKTIEKEAAKHDRVIPVLIEVNVACEESKFGVSAEQTKDLVRAISVLPHVHICGLMTSAPFVENAEDNRGVFDKLHELSVDIAEENIDNVSMRVLSMGMTNDYNVAVEEGATLVRVGTAIFGARDYGKRD
jgi:pyridoxal phosphate enzyme (YggS family)